MSAERDVTACCIIIGDEILSGRTQDSNLAYLGKELNECGVRLREARIVRDVEGDIVAAVNECRSRYDYVFTSGGIGPTHDDITTAAIAKAFAVAVVQSEDALRRMQAYYRSETISEARLKMAAVPQGAVLVDNPVSAAPGYRIDNVYVFAGIPAILRAMFESIRHELDGGAPMRSKALTALLGESRLAPGLADIQQRHPQVAIGSYPFSRDGRFGTSVVMRSTDRDRLEAVAGEVSALIEGLGASPERETY